VFCNQIISVSKAWNDKRNSGFKSLKFGDFSDIHMEIVDDISNYADKIRAAIPWKVGDFVYLIIKWPNTQEKLT